MRNFHSPNQTRLIAALNNALLFILLLLLRGPQRFHKINPSMSVFYFTIWRICLNHQSLNRNTPYNFKIFSSLQRATIYTYWVQRKKNKDY